MWCGTRGRDTSGSNCGKATTRSIWPIRDDGVGFDAEATVRRAAAWAEQLRPAGNPGTRRAAGRPGRHPIPTGSRNERARLVPDGAVARRRRPGEGASR